MTSTHRHHRSRASLAVPTNETPAPPFDACSIAFPPQDLSRRGKGHGAESAGTVDRERYVDRPVLTAFAVLLGAVERIHDPDTGLREPFRIARRFLAQNSIFGIAAREDSLEEPVRRLIADVAEERSLPSIRAAKRLEPLPRRPRRFDREENVGRYGLSPASFRTY
jgi:hypothetical protein